MSLEIQSSHLCLRFYKRAGWTKELLVPCLEVGGLCDTTFLGDKEEYSYWTLDRASRFNADKLLAIAGDVFDYKNNKLSKEESREYILEMNW